MKLLNLLRTTDGTSLIELSLILPILILMLLAVLDCGLLLRQDMIVADSARAGAEYALTTTTAADTTGMHNTATLSAGDIPGYKAVPLSFCTCVAGGSTASCTGSCASGSMPIQYAQVTASANLPLLFKVQGLPATIAVQSVSRVRTAWTAGR